MSESKITFDNGAAYERYMGKWSQTAGDAFLDWLAPQPRLRWLDVGCGNGAFTQRILDRCNPAAVDGIDPSGAQLEFARTRKASGIAQFRIGDAMQLPFADDAFDVAVMPLVIFFVPEPAKGLSEMARVVRTGGIVSAYAWDVIGGGFPYDALWTEMRAMGAVVGREPSSWAANIDAMQKLWSDAGLEAVETREIIVQRTFTDFDDYWTTILGGPSTSRGLKTMPPDDLATLKTRMRKRLPANAAGAIVCSARANAAKGRVPR